MASMPAMGTLYRELATASVRSIGVGSITGIVLVSGGGGPGNRYPEVG